MPKPAGHGNPRNRKGRVPGAGNGSISPHVVWTWYIGAPAYLGNRSWQLRPHRASPTSRPFRAAAAAAPHKSGRAAGNAALLSVGVAIVVAGVFLLQGITSIPRHVDCNFSKHRPCHSFVGN